MNKMRVLVLVYFFTMLSFTSMEQAGASIVYDPSNGATLASMLSTVEDLKETTESWKANADFLKKIVNEGKEVKRLVSLLESLVCSTDQLEIYIAADKTMTLCDNKIQLDLALGKIDGISGKIKMIASGAIVLSQYETIQSLKDLNDELEEAIMQTSSLNSMMRARLWKKMVKDYESETAYENTGMGTVFNVK